MNLRKCMIWFADQHTMKPQHTIIDVTVALRLAFCEAALSVDIT